MEIRHHVSFQYKTVNEATDKLERLFDYINITHNCQDWLKVTVTYIWQALLRFGQGATTAEFYAVCHIGCLDFEPAAPLHCCSCLKSSCNPNSVRLGASVLLARNATHLRGGQGGTCRGGVESGRAGCAGRGA
jgi:hypothetical protein